MSYNINENKNVVGLGALMTNSSKYDMDALEKEVINGANVIFEEEENDTKQYKKDMEALSNKFNIDEFATTDTYGFDNVEPTTTPHEFSSFDFSNKNTSMMDDQLGYMTMEQKKQSYVDDVLQDLNNDESLEFDIDKEKDEDDKNILLEQIDMLRDTLDDDGIRLNNVPIVTKDNSISDIKNIYKILSIKNDRNRYCSFAEELILSAAYGIEYMFDGKNTYFGRTPDLGGWSSTVRIKLRRCRYQTSTLVKDIMQDYSFGPSFQLMLELIPSLFLYSRTKKLANKEVDYDNAISQLNATQN